MEQLAKKKEIVSIFMRNNILVSRAVLDKLNQPSVVDDWHKELLNGTHPEKLLSSDKTKVSDQQLPSNVKIVWEYEDLPKKRTVQDFTDMFNARYKAIHKMLSTRQELQNLTSINRLRSKQDWEKVSVIGIVLDKRETKNGHIVLHIEDRSGQTKAIIKKDSQEVFKDACDVVLDEVIGISGATSGEAIFVNSIIQPDIPRKSPTLTQEDVYVAVLACIHVGSDTFEHQRFENFIKWVNGEAGNEEQKEKARKLKYVFVCGDIVDGVGVYPGQDKELYIHDITEQYNECAKLLSKIRKDLTIILAPGNHDVGRLAEPQPPLSRKYAGALYDLPNTVLVCNPCILNIHRSENFPGLNVLMYHGFSFIEYSENVPSIKETKDHMSDRAPEVMKFLLRRRHLAPQNKSTLYIPDARADPLVIETIPDLFFAGHIHKSGTLTYRGCTIVAGSCFQAKTAFQEKVGIDPEPGVVPLVNLKNRDITLMRF